MTKKILVIGDIHFPFANVPKLQQIYKAIEKEKPQVVLQVGDLADQYSYSRYNKKVGFIKPEKEMQLFKEQATKFWSTVQQLAPKAKCYQLIGNHDERLAKRIGDKLPEAKHIIDDYIKFMFTFPNVTTMASERDELKIDGIMFIHGYLSKLGDHAKKNLMSVVVGHSHRAGLAFFKHRGKILWELNVGHVANEKALPLQYGQQKFKDWTVGYGLLKKVNGLWQPQFVPLE